MCSLTGPPVKGSETLGSGGGVEDAQSVTTPAIVNCMGWESRERRNLEWHRDATTVIVEPVDKFYGDHIAQVGDASSNH